MAIEVTLAACGPLDALGEDWRALEARAEGSVFLSWHWIGSWLAALAAAERPEILTIRRAGAIVGLAALGRATERRHGLLVAHRLCLNETGRAERDVLAVEWNGILADATCAGEVARAAIAFLVREVAGWDELVLGGIAATDDARDYAGFARAEGLATRLQARSPSRFVDLARVRDGGDYLDLLSRNTRAQLRRAMRRYEASGPLAFTPARDTAEALAWFEEMATLHQATWTRRGMPGSFGNPFFAAFHRRLIADAVPAGAAEIARVTAGTETVGILYNLVWRGHVCNYQSGLAYTEDDNAMKPGLVSHALAVRSYAARGLTIYDFLAGDSRYKASLASDEAELVWLVARRRKLKFAAEEFFRSAKSMLHRT